MPFSIASRPVVELEHDPVAHRELPARKLNSIRAEAAVRVQPRAGPHVEGASVRAVLGDHHRVLAGLDRLAVVRDHPRLQVLRVGGLDELGELPPKHRLVDVPGGRRVCVELPAIQRPPEAAARLVGNEHSGYSTDALSGTETRT